MRAPFQILVFPFIKDQDEYLYAVFHRKDLNFWQAISGGGEGEETPLEAMKREIFEEAQISPDSACIRLASAATIPATNICGLKWGDDIIMIPEITFGVEAPSKDLAISGEHTEYAWLSCAEAMARLKYDSNKSALWELDFRLRNGQKNSKLNRQSIEKYYLAD